VALESEPANLVPLGAKSVKPDWIDPGQPVFASGSAQTPEAVREASEQSRVFWAMNALSTIIACYGLFANSPAVVIGAMVVAMLLGPISGVALGLNDSDRPLLRMALLTLTAGIAWILAIAVVVGLIHRDVPLTGEILSRTDPRLFDLIIALAGGAAGAVAVLSPRVGTAIVGVAVATALIPPLAAAGILLARADFTLAGGALLLALTNIVAIQLAFSAVFWISGYRRLTAIRERGILAFLRRDLPSIAFVCILAAVLGVQLHHAIAESLFESQVRTVLHRQFDDASGFRLIGVHFDKAADATIVRAVIRGPKAPSAAGVAAAQAELPGPPNGLRLRLRVRFVEVVIVTPRGPTLGGDEDEQ
jgi:uncharacterized hydrophobic protein (TIGR00271 family)